MAFADSCIKPQPKATAEQFACEVAPARRRVSHPPHEFASSYPQHLQPHDASAFISTHSPGSVPRRINGEVILRRGVILAFLFPSLALSPYISCIFFCVLIIPFYLFFVSLTFLSRLA